MSIIIIATAFILAGILIGLVTAATAPIGYEDAAGFHFGNEHGQKIPSRKKAHAVRRPSSATLTHKPA